MGSSEGVHSKKTFADQSSLMCLLWLGSGDYWLLALSHSRSRNALVSYAQNKFSLLKGESNLADVGIG